MNLKKYFFIFYAWITVFLWVIVIFWFSSLQNLELYSDDYSLLLERLIYIFAYGFLMLLVFRALIATFRLTIDRLAKAKSKREEQEDSEFVIITETLLLSNAIFISTFIAIANYQYLNDVIGRANDTYSFLANLLGILIAALITYSWPVLNEVELKLFRVLK